MRHLLILLFTAFFPFQTLSAKPIILNCNQDDGKTEFTLIIDLDNKNMKLGAYNYEITQVNDNYISAFSRSIDVGGEIISINRISGIFKRAMVGIFYYGRPKSGDVGKFDTLTYEGVCAKQQF